MAPQHGKASSEHAVLQQHSAARTREQPKSCITYFQHVLFSFQSLPFYEVNLLHCHRACFSKIKFSKAEKPRFFVAVKAGGARTLRHGGLAGLVRQHDAVDEAQLLLRVPRSRRRL